MKKLFMITLVVAAMLLPLASASAVEMLIGPTGVIQYDESNSQNGYVLFSVAGTFKSYLIDLEGYVVHEWQTESGPGLHDRLLPNGNLLRGFRPTVDYDGNPVGSGVGIGGASGGVQEFTWDGTKIWEYINKTDTSVQHHTFMRDLSDPDNGNTFILLWEKWECADAIAAGRDPDTCDEAEGLWPDYVEEVDHNNPPNVVWEWHVKDHVVQDFDPNLPNYGDPELNKDKIDLNFYYPVPWGFKDWNHGNTIEYNPARDELIFNSRNWGELYAIDHATGNITYRWGNPCATGSGECPSFNDNGDEQLFGAHCARYIDDSTNLIVFDNGWVRPSGNNSRSVEIARDVTIDLSADPTQPYPMQYSGNPDGDPIAWFYQSQDPNGFYTTFQGGTARLPNGNTFITSTDGGHLFEVTPDKKVVWEFIAPPRDRDTDAAICINNDRVGATIHRAHMYPKDFPAFAGKDLSRKYHIAEGCTEFWKIWDEQVYPGSYTPPAPEPAPTGWGTSGLTAGAGGGGGASGGSSGGGSGAY